MSNNSYRGLTEIHQDGDKIMSLVLWALLAISFGLASWYDTWLEAIIIGLPAVLIPTFLARTMTGATVTRLSIGAAFMVMTALMIHQSHGMIEAHFSVFVLLAFLLYYRDWKPIVMAAGVIAVHHVGFFVLQDMQAPLFLLPETNGLFWIVVVHALFVVFETAILCIMAVKSEKETRLSATVFYKMNRISEQQTVILKEASSISSQLKQASDEITQSALSLSSASGEQAASLEQSSASIEEMAASIQHNFQNSHDTKTIASNAAIKAEETGVSVNDTVTAMNNIAQNIGIIEDIAYKTNLLALNAAIEAARAGEHGKGFAVVADEVRKLAERSQTAAQEIGELAENSVKIANSAGKALTEMVPDIKNTAELVTEISAASEEQSTGVHQVSTAIRQLDSIAQQNAQASEQLSATAVRMNELVSSLADAMSQLNQDTIDNNSDEEIA